MTLRARLSIALCLLTAVPAAAALRLRAHERYVASEAYEDVYYVPPAEWLPLLSLGYREALADLLWMRALVYFGDEVLSQGHLAHVFEYTDAIVALDPDFRAAYHWIATAGIYRPGEVRPDDVERTVAVMRRGLDRFPDDGELAWSIGATLAFELPPLLHDPRAREQARSEGADYLAMASRLGAAPEWAVLTNAGILARVGRTEAAVRHLEEMYAAISDEGVREEIQAAIAAMRSEAYSQAFAEAEAEEESGRVAELPYLEPDLYFLTGARRGDDWRRTFREGFARSALEDEISDVAELEP